ncbi:MAG: phosphoribosyltransferase [Opitutales bacterium]
MSVYEHRDEAGRALVPHLRELGLADPVLLALPRGGVPVAAIVASELGWPLEVMLVRKLGVPGQEELAMGAVAEGGEIVINENVVSRLDLQQGQIEDAARRENELIVQRGRDYRQGRERIRYQGRDAVLIDDGLATGATMRVSAQTVRQHEPASLTVAVPVAPPDTIARLGELVDHIICPLQPEHFGGVGQFYRDFSQVTDDKVRAYLR